jgi:hypothetical protein
VDFYGQDGRKGRNLNPALGSLSAQGGEKLGEEVWKGRWQNGGDGRKFSGGEAAEEGGEFGEGRGQLLDLGEGGFGLGIKVGAVRAGLGASNSESLDSLQELWRQAGGSAGAAGAAVQFLPHRVALAFPLGGLGSMAAGVGDAG